MFTVTSIISDELFELVAEYNAKGGVMEFMFFHVSGSADKQVHQHVAMQTLQPLYAESAAYFNAIPARFKGIINPSSQISITPLQMEDGQPISPENFFGPFFDWESKLPLLNIETLEKHNGFTASTPHYYKKGMALPENEVTIKRELFKGDSQTIAYTDAFLYPVHAFADDGNEKACHFFNHFNNRIFGRFDNLEIYAWSTDCSNYFDDGKEWWGHFFWTVYSPDKHWFVGIVASTTD